MERIRQSIERDGPYIAVNQVPVVAAADLLCKAAAIVDDGHATRELGFGDGTPVRLRDRWIVVEHDSPAPQ
jgi:hypothetical protein